MNRKSRTVVYILQPFLTKNHVWTPAYQLVNDIDGHCCFVLINQQIDTKRGCTESQTKRPKT